MVHLGLMLSRLALKIQAAVFNSQFFDLFSHFTDGSGSSVVGVGRRDVVQALVVAVIVVMIDVSVVI